MFVEEFFLRKKQGEYLGDLALDVANGVRLNSCIANENCYLATLDRREYNSFIKEEKAKLRWKEVEFIVNKYIFKKISKVQFDRRYINDFTLEEYRRGMKLTKENEDIKFVYFLKEGTLQLNISKNLIELSALVKQLNKFKVLKPNPSYLLKNGKN